GDHPEAGPGRKAEPGSDWMMRVYRFALGSLTTRVFQSTFAMGCKQEDAHAGGIRDPSAHSPPRPEASRSLVAVATLTCGKGRIGSSSTHRSAARSSSERVGNGDRPASRR